jgi:23S rRNA (adenine2503-C2)-methyltransferase
MVSIYSQEFENIQDIVESWGEPEYRAGQIWDGLYKNYWNNPSQFTTLSKPLRKKIADKFIFNSLTALTNQKTKNNLTTKTLFQLNTGDAIETVLMLSEGSKGKRSRVTICLSTQVGCGIGCAFCATGQMGFRRNLDSSEIIEQLLYFSRRLTHENRKVTNVVFMGMGEPFTNYIAVNRSIEIMNSPEGINLGSRRITISTIGIVPGILQLAKEKPQVNLAVSLHAASNELRNTLVPINQKYPLEILIETCLKYVEITNRRITFEWALIQKVNDSLTQAKTLAHLLQPFLKNGSSFCHVNLIPLNATTDYEQGPSTLRRAFEFQKYLNSSGIPCTIRKRRGIEIQAGCGQLTSAVK